MISTITIITLPGPLFTRDVADDGFIDYSSSGAPSFISSPPDDHDHPIIIPHRQPPPPYCLSDAVIVICFCHILSLLVVAGWRHWVGAWLHATPTIHYIISYDTLYYCLHATHIRHYIQYYYFSSCRHCQASSLSLRSSRLINIASLVVFCFIVAATLRISRLFVILQYCYLGAIIIYYDHFSSLFFIWLLLCLTRAHGDIGVTAYHYYAAALHACCHRHYTRLLALESEHTYRCHIYAASSLRACRACHLHYAIILRYHLLTCCRHWLLVITLLLLREKRHVAASPYCAFVGDITSYYTFHTISSSVIWFVFFITYRGYISL